MSTGLASISNDVVSKICDRRKNLGISRVEAAKLWGYGRHTVERLERQESRYLSLEKLGEYAESLGLTLQVTLHEADFKLPSDMMELSDTQLDIVVFIRRIVRLTNSGPTLAGLVTRFKWKTADSAHRNINQLKLRGVVATTGEGDSMQISLTEKWALPC